MDTQDLLEHLNSWFEFYAENEHINDPDEEKTEDQKKWEAGMLRLIAILQLPESLENTPAKQPFFEAVELAKKNDPNDLKIVQEQILKVANYLSGA